MEEVLYWRWPLDSDAWFMYIINKIRWLTQNQLQYCNSIGKLWKNALDIGQLLQNQLWHRPWIGH